MADLDTDTIARWRARLDEAAECRPFQRDELEELLDAAERLARLVEFAKRQPGAAVGDAVEAVVKAEKERA